jgi:hypothetical protein
MFPGGKGSRCAGLTPCHLHVPIVMKSGSLNLLEPSGPVNACNGIALPLLLLLQSELQLKHLKFTSLFSEEVLTIMLLVKHVTKKLCTVKSS